jgi:hypothetical protein
VSMTGLVFEAQGGADRTTLMFDAAVPGYTLQPNQGGATFASPGGPIHLAGSYGLKLLLNGVRIPTRLQQQADLTPASAVLQEIRFIGVSGTTAEFGIGLSRAVCPAISTSGGPPSLLLDFPAA